MDRRVFVKLGILGAGAMTIPLLHCRSNDGFSMLLQQPALLSQICDEKVLREIGIDYRKLKPQEDKQGQLVSHLMIDEHGKKIASDTPDAALEKILDQLIKSDFKEDKTITLKGWILSVTEARQCALFSLSPL
jgi:hypothetical protein